MVNQVNKKFVEMSKVQCLEAAVAADAKVLKAAAAAQGPSSTADHPFEGKAYVQVSLLCIRACLRVYMRMIAVTPLLLLLLWCGVYKAAGSTHIYNPPPPAHPKTLFFKGFDSKNRNTRDGGGSGGKGPAYDSRNHCLFYCWVCTSSCLDT